MQALWLSMRAPLPSSNMAEPKRVGLRIWMAAVLAECARASRGLDADAVHDLRVALRRCRSMADGFLAFDPYPAWRAMKGEGKRLFSRMGDLRDVQVMIEWVQRLGAPGDGATERMLQYLDDREQRLKRDALDALQSFDAGKWQVWTAELTGRAARIGARQLVFQHLALQRWHEAHELHRQALRNRSHLGFHRLRIGLKRFRYTVENFLPHLLDAWSADLRELQDLLGENHDLHILLQTAVRIGAFQDRNGRDRWRDRVGQERALRLERYRQKMCGRDSLWPIWRAGLPTGKKVRSSAFARLKVWAANRDPDPAHANHVTRLSSQLFRSLKMYRLLGDTLPEDARLILEVAAILHDVGRARAERGHHKASYRLVRGLDPPFGLNPAHLRLAALVARYHCGTLPRPTHKCLSGLAGEQRRLVTFLAGILRLANAFDSAHDGHILGLEASQSPEVMIIRAEGYSQDDQCSRQLAGARRLLEIACNMPVWIEPSEPATDRQERVSE
jgi:CHAD domain-containing protein